MPQMNRVEGAKKEPNGFAFTVHLFGMIEDECFCLAYGLC